MKKKLSWVINLNQVGPPKCVEQALDRLHAQVKPFLCLKILFVIGFCWLNSKRCAIICVPSSQLFQRIGHGYRVLGDEALYARFCHIFMQGFVIFYHIFMQGFIIFYHIFMQGFIIFFAVTRRSRRDSLRTIMGYQGGPSAIFLIFFWKSGL